MCLSSLNNCLLHCLHQPVLIAAVTRIERMGRLSVVLAGCKNGVVSRVTLTSYVVRYQVLLGGHKSLLSCASVPFYEQTLEHHLERQPYISYMCIFSGCGCSDTLVSRPDALDNIA